MLRQFVWGLALSLGLAGAATAATIEDSSATVLWTPNLSPNAIVINSESLSLVSDSTPAPVLDFLIFTGDLDGSTRLTVQDDLGAILLQATGSDLTIEGDQISALLSNTIDPAALFGPRLLLTVTIPGFMPQIPGLLSGDLLIADAPAVIPVPASLPLLAFGAAALGLAARRRRA